MFHAYRYWHFAIMFLIAHKSANSCVSFAGTIGGHDDDTIKFCQAHGITYEAYSPLGGDDLGGAHRLNTNCGLMSFGGKLICRRRASQVVCVHRQVRDDVP